MKLWKIGCAYLRVLEIVKVYHFGSLTTKKTWNNGAKTFFKNGECYLFKKWGSDQTFKKLEPKKI